MKATTVHAFRLFAPDDPCERKFRNWSRVYEYPAVLAELAAINNGGRLRVHNAAAGGWHGCHQRFKRCLAAEHDAIHTDLVAKRGASLYDIREPVPDWEASFDAVLCISALEHLSLGDQRPAIDNLARQVRPGGRLILTFDLPGMDLALLEEVAGRPITRPAIPLNGANSQLPNRSWAHLSVGLLSLTFEEESQWFW